MQHLCHYPTKTYLAASDYRLCKRTSGSSVAHMTI